MYITILRDMEALSSFTNVWFKHFGRRIVQEADQLAMVVVNLTWDCM